MITFEDIQELQDKGLITPEQARNIALAYGFVSAQPTIDQEKDTEAEQAEPILSSDLPTTRRDDTQSLLKKTTAESPSSPQVPLAKPESMPRKQVNYLAILFATLGGLLTLGGISTLAVTYWWDIPAWIKLLGAILVMYAFWGVGFYFREFRKTAVKTGYACCMVGACMWGVCNKLFAYLYHVSTLPSNGVLTFLIGILPFPWIIRLRGLFLLFVASCFLWAGLIIYENPGTPSTYFLIPGMSIAYSGLGYLFKQPRLAGGAYRLYAPLANICGTWFFAAGYPLSVFYVPAWTPWSIACMLVPCILFIRASIRKNISTQAASLLSLLIFLILSFKNNLPEQSGVPILLHLLFLSLPLAIGLFIKLLQTAQDKDLRRITNAGIWLGVVTAMAIASFQYQWHHDPGALFISTGIRLPSFHLEHAITFPQILQYLILWIFPAIILKIGSKQKSFPNYALALSFIFILLTLLAPSLESGVMPTGSFGILALLLFVCLVIGWRHKFPLSIQSIALTAYILSSRALEGSALSLQHMLLLILPAFSMGVASLWHTDELTIGKRLLIQRFQSIALALISLDCLLLTNSRSSCIIESFHPLCLLFAAIPLLPFIVKPIYEANKNPRGNQASISAWLGEWSFSLVFAALYLCLLFVEQTASPILILVCWAIMAVRYRLLDNSRHASLLPPSVFFKGHMIRPLTSKQEIVWPLAMMGITSSGIIFSGIKGNPAAAIFLFILTLLPLTMCIGMAFRRSPVHSLTEKTIPGIVTTILVSVAICSQLYAPQTISSIVVHRPEILICLWGIALALSWFFRNRSVWNWCLVGLTVQICLIALPVTVIIGLFLTLCIPVVCGFRPVAKYAHLPVIFLIIVTLGQMNESPFVLLFTLIPITALYLSTQPASYSKKYLPIVLFALFLIGNLTILGMSHQPTAKLPPLAFMTSCSIPLLWVLRMGSNIISRREPRPDLATTIQYAAFVAGFIFLLYPMRGSFLFTSIIFILSSAYRTLIINKLQSQTILLPITTGILAFALFDFTGELNKYTFGLPALICFLGFLSYSQLSRQKVIFTFSLFFIQLSLIQLWSNSETITTAHLGIAAVPLLVPCILFTSHAIQQGTGSIRSWGSMAYLLVIPLAFLIMQPSSPQNNLEIIQEIALGLWFTGIILVTFRDGSHRNLFNALFACLLMLPLMGSNFMSMVIGASQLMVSFCIAKNRKLSRSAIVWLGIGLFLAQLCCYKNIVRDRNIELSSIAVCCLPGIILFVQLKKWVPKLEYSRTLLFSLAMIATASAAPVLPPFGVMLILVFSGASSIISGLHLARASIINCGVILIALVAASLAINLLDSLNQKGLGLLICGLTLLGLAYITERTRRSLINRIHPSSPQ